MYKKTNKGKDCNNKNNIYATIDYFTLNYKKKNMYNKKNGFSLLEVLIIIVVISIGIITVITALNSGNIYLQKSREKIIAINLAREGMEQMMNIRDTNRKKNAGKKKESWLKVNPMDTSTDWFSSGSYIILTQTSGGQQYFYGSGIITNFNINSGFSVNNLKYSLCQSTTGWQACPGQQPSSIEGKFFRRVYGVGLYDKNFGGQILDCPTSTTISCSNSSAKEYRFCVVVDYIGHTTSKVELCSILTNFK